MVMVEGGDGDDTGDSTGEGNGDGRGEADGEGDGQGEEDGDEVELRLVQTVRTQLFAFAICIELTSTMTFG